MKRLLIVVNVGWFFVSHRLPIALAAKAAGYEVHVAAALDARLDRDTVSLLTERGLLFHELHVTRSAAGPLAILNELREIASLYRRISPDIVHLVTLKPVLLGGICARVLRVRNVVLAIPGRGSVFSAKGIRAGLRRWLALLMYRLAYVSGRTRVIIQNVEDREYFVGRRVFHSSDVRLIRGSGVDATQFWPAPEPTCAPTVVLASRMLREKGIAQFVAAATELKRRRSTARFLLVGDPDEGNPSSHTEEELRAWAASGVVEWCGHRTDMNRVFADCHIVCLPTYYGEGVPKVLIEAAACGRPIVTTDTPGCRDIVRDRENGLLVPPGDVPALANALELLIENPELRKSMGSRGRARVEEFFDLNDVVANSLAIYREFPQ